MVYFSLREQAYHCFKEEEEEDEELDTLQEIKCISAHTLSSLKDTKLLTVKLATVALPSRM